MPSLFRQEVIEARKSRLTGSILIAQPVSAHAMTIVIALFVGCAAVALTMGTYSRTETAAGYLVPDAGMAKSYPPRAGTIEQVLVQEGELVEAGAPLVRISAEQMDGAGMGVESRQLALLAEQQATLEQRMTHAHVAARDKRQRLEAEIAGLETEIAQLTERFTVQQALAKAAEQDYAALDDLIAKGFATRAEQSQRRQAYLSQRAQSQQISQTLTSLKTRLKQGWLELAAVPAAEAEAARELKGVLAELKQR